MAGFWGCDPSDGMTLPGAARLDRALAKVEADATDANTIKAAAEIVLFTARQRSRSKRVRRTGRVSARKDRGVIRFGSAAVPWTVPSHFGHGSPQSPRPQGGWMPRNPFLFDARDDREEEVVDLFLRRTTEAIRKAGLG